MLFCLAGFFTTSPLDARTAHLDFVKLRAALCGFDAHSLPCRKE